jgi:hypothetical protein
MKRLSAIFASLIFAASAYAESLALVFYDKDCPQQFATINGSREALRDLSLRFKKQLTIENFTPQADVVKPDHQAEALMIAHKRGARGAILFEANGDKKLLHQTIKELKEKSFPIVIIGRETQSTDDFAAVVKNDKKFREIFKANFPEKTKKENFKLLFVVKGASEAKISKEDALKTMPPNIGADNVEAISENFATEFYSCRMFSELQKKFGEDWYYYDNYGVIILDERILADTVPFRKDTDKAFTFCPQTSPILSEFLRSGDIQICVADDYFGYGYIASVKLWEKIFDKKNPTSKTEYLTPLLYTPADLEKYNSDWINFLK